MSTEFMVTINLMFGAPVLDDGAFLLGLALGWHAVEVKSNQLITGPCHCPRRGPLGGRDALTIHAHAAIPPALHSLAGM
jgi:hypothetical protein